MPMYWHLKSWESVDRERTIDRIGALRKALAQAIPRRTAMDTLLLATWNLRDFDSNKFGHGPRLDESYHYIAEVIAAFDLVAIQEVNEDMRPFERVMGLLGPAWRYIATDLTEGTSGNGERMVFVYNADKVQFKHIAGEIVLPKSARVGGEDQFARTPFLVRFQSGWFKFYLCTVHLYYGAQSGEGYERRVKEIESIAKFLRKRAEKDGQNYIMLGDMNVVSPDDATMQALKKHKFLLPSDLTLDAAPSRWVSNMGKDKHYDQIAFYVRKDELELGPSPNNAGVFNYYEALFPPEMAETYHALSHGRGKWPDDPAKRETYYLKNWRTWQMSDHLPLWVELKIDFTDNYLARIRAGTQPLARPTPDATDS
ncbi:MAG: endonuclease/exonuclease/phosphatase family protein [Lentisphaeria bacterium]|jgi:endonuclease/exonuclease/phosphatase family metal-dependent hydrolase|nr:endonuclease/exonuclease/phosphatase family protein [Lentisphaeria bacterium]